MGIILDVIVIAIFALNIFICYKKGLVRLAVGLIAVLTAIVLSIILYKPISNLVIKNTGLDKKIENVINIIINIFILASFYIMIAGFGAYLKQEINLNNIIGSGILAIACIIIFKMNIKGFVRANEILIPILIIVVLFIRFFKF